MSNRDEWVRWAARRDQQIGAEYGPLSLTALHWLSDEDASFLGVPGRWRVAGGDVVVTADAKDGVTIDDRPVDGSVTVSTEADVRAWIGNVIVEIIERDGAHAIRVRDPKAPARLAFDTLPRFDFNPEWAVDARFDAAENPRRVRIGSVVDGIGHDQVVGGELVFTVDGSEYRLTAFGEPDHLWLLFRDATSGVSTPGAARSLRVDAPGENGRVVLDFNRASCLPCAFNDFSTCPLPPPENRLPFAVTAGEKKP